MAKDPTAEQRPRLLGLLGMCFHTQITRSLEQKEFCVNDSGMDRCGFDSHHPLHFISQRWPTTRVL